MNIMVILANIRSYGSYRETNATNNNISAKHDGPVIPVYGEKFPGKSDQLAVNKINGIRNINITATKMSISLLSAEMHALLAVDLYNV